MLPALGLALQRAWWRPRRGLAAQLLAPFAALVAHVAARRRRAPPPARRPGCPVIVVGNVVVGGAGKTPTTIALVQLLRSWGWTPGIVSRGHGRRSDAALVLDAASAGRLGAADVGDEPLLMHRRTGAPVAVARARLAAAEALRAAHPEVDLLIADDGLQHHGLARDIELVVFDSRGLGNGAVLPAGPLREDPATLWPRPPGAPARLVLLNGAWPATAGAPALPAPADRTWPMQRHLGGAQRLPDWARGPATGHVPLAALPPLLPPGPDGRPLPCLAAAGIGEPGRFFAMLEAAGLPITRLPLPDHSPLDPLPWPAATPAVLVTEKDAVKLLGRDCGATAVWVCTLDFGFDTGFASALREALHALPWTPAPPAP